MSKILKLYLLSILTVLNAANIESEIGINVGLNSTKNEEGNKFKNPSISLTYQDNKYVISPRVDIDYTKVENDHASSLLKVSVNGVYEYENKTYTVPYVLAGVGYESVSGGTKDVFESHPFVQGGVGVRVDLEKGFKARVEGKVLQIIGGNDEENEFMLTAGISMPFDITNPFGKPKVNRVRQVVPRPIVTTIIRPIVRPVVTPIVRPLPVKREVVVLNSNNNECPIKINAPDFDRDGIANTIDQCPSTPCNFTVDNYGCPVKTTLKINFTSNSAEVKSASLFKIYNFANFLLNNRGSMVTIIGHTDSAGAVIHNMNLSERRANAVVNILINRGISAARLRAFGRGESQPLTSNNTASGKAMNRRIEAELSYPKGRR